MKEILKDITKKSTQELKSLQSEIVQKMSDLAIAAFGLIAALAWNDAIKSLFDAIFPQNGGIIAQFIYAILVTALIVFVTIRLGKLSNLAKKRLENDKIDSLDKS
ncbi:MAG: DUF5654 family protein [Candidatus Buchananbacteria bacterium]